MNHSTVAPLETPPVVVPSEEPVLAGVKKKKPKKVLHFSDGTLELTDSSDEEECRREKVAETQLATINPTTLEWVPWLFYQTSYAGNKALAVCDYLGEYLANFFGILSPKYEYEIEQYNKMVAEEEEKKKRDLEGGWTPKVSDIVSDDPKNDSESVALESLKDSLTQ